MVVSRFKGLTALALGLAAGMTMASSAQAQGANPAVRGKLLFLQCGACHAVVPGAPAKVGPNLSGVFGRKAGAAANFKYSPAMAKAGLTWDEANLDKWLLAPAKVVPGTIMLFPGLPKAEDRKAVIAYLKTLK